MGTSAPRVRGGAWLVVAALVAAAVGVSVWIEATASDEDERGADSVRFPDQLTIETVPYPGDLLPYPGDLPGYDELPEATLTVHSDGCGVIRSDLPAEPEGLTWVISDTDGFQVLGRNAVGETRYRYFRSGTYTVVLEAWGGQAYVPISNTVTIHC